MRKKEESLHLLVCNYLKIQYPKVIFMSDMASGMKLTMGQAVRAKKMRSSRGMPDLFIAESKESPVGQTLHGLFIELKREGTKIFLKDGVTPVGDQHIQEQSHVLQILRNKNYMAVFGIGFTQTKNIIDHYLK